jgi:NADPH2:quinone reductase
MPQAIRIHRTGGPEVLAWEADAVGAPGPGQVRLKQTAVGLNFVDVYHRNGHYPVPLPFVPGVEGAGVVEAVGAGVSHLAIGDRVAYAMVLGAYAESRLIAADRVVKLPAALDERTAASMMLKGMTARYLIREVHQVAAGDIILIHAAAGGVGLIACQWAASLGATVIGTVSSDEKAALAKANGCHHPIVSTREDVPARVLAITGGKKASVVYDSIGKDTFMKSLNCLRPRGLLVLFGSASGPVPPLDLGVLAQKGSLQVTCPSLGTFIATRALLEESCNDLFAAVAAGTVTIRVNQTYALRDAARAHRDLEARATTGSTVLTVM